MNVDRKKEPFFWGLLTGSRPPERLPLSELATKNVHLSGSQYGAKYDLSVVPAHKFVLDEFKNPRVKEIANIAPTGFGKTTIFEVCISYGVAEDPGDALILGQNDKLIQQWMESRLLKVLKRSPWTRGFIPTGKERNDFKKTSIIFPHMSLFTGGANESNTQEKSMRYCLGDEVWKWAQGMIGEFLRRHHNRLNRKMLLQSQGGDEETEWHDFCKEGKWHDGHHLCPACKKYQPITLGMIRYDRTKDQNGEYDWPKIKDSVRCVCPGCDEEFADTDQNRRQWSRAIPVWNGNKHFPDRVTFSWSFMTVWTKEWFDVAKLHILAIDQMKRGNLEPMKQLINKEMGQFWAAPRETPSLDTGGEAYTKEMFNDGRPWEGEHARHMTIDVQKGHFWVRIRAWKIGNGTSSRLLWEGKVDTWQSLFDLQDRFHVENPDVYIDGRYEIDEVVRQITAHCGANPDGHWRILIGQDNSKGYQFDVGTTKRPKKIWKIFSKFQHGTTSRGQRFRTIHFSNLRAKDALSGIMELKEGIFGIPTDASPNYVKQMASERKVESNSGVWRWEKIKEHYDNHLWDCEVMGIVAAAIKGILRIETTE